MKIARQTRRELERYEAMEQGRGLNAERWTLVRSNSKSASKRSRCRLRQGFKSNWLLPNSMSAEESTYICTAHPTRTSTVAMLWWPIFQNKRRRTICLERLTGHLDKTATGTERQRRQGILYPNMERTLFSLCNLMCPCLSESVGLPVMEQETVCGAMRHYNQALYGHHGDPRRSKAV